MSSIRISHHAAQRYIDRVDSTAAPAAARMRVAQILARGRWRASPRHWMSETNPAPGTRFVYWAGLPGVCVIVVNATATTLVTRAVTTAARRERRLMVIGLSTGDRRRHTPQPRWRWSGEIEEIA